MYFVRSNSDVLVVLADAFRESVNVVYQHKVSEPDMRERPVVQEQEVLNYLSDQWSIVNLYNESFMMGEDLKPLLKAGSFSRANKNDTINMVWKSLKNIRAYPARDENKRLNEAKFILELLSTAYEETLQPTCCP